MSEIGYSSYRLISVDIMWLTYSLRIYLTTEVRWKCNQQTEYEEELHFGDNILQLSMQVYDESAPR